MSTQQLSLANVITISATQTPSGISAPNTSNLALFTTDTPSPSAVYGIFLQSSDVATAYGSNSTTFAMAEAVFSQQPNILLPGGYLVIIPFLPSETLAQAIVRTQTTVQYFGVMSTQLESQTDTLAAAAVIQANNLIGFFVNNSTASIQSGGTITELTASMYSQSRGLFYDDITANALNYQASYAGRALSTLFSGSATCQDMAYKQLVGVAPDPNITQTIANLCQTAGADCYPSFGNIDDGFIFASGANNFFDNVYNLQSFSIALQTTYFNYLAGTSTKVPQTEAGMNGIKGALTGICQQYVTNGYLAPGTWTSSQTFGNQNIFLANIASFGFYVYSTPIAQQSQTNRANRLAPPIQIAVKEAGSINKGNVIVLVNP